MMIVIMKDTGKRETHNASYGARLIEQGKATPAPKEAPKRGRKAEPAEVIADESEGTDPD